MTRDEFAEKLGCTEKTIYNWETGYHGRVPDVNELREIAKITGRSLEWLMTGHEKSDAPRAPADAKEFLAEFETEFQAFYADGELTMFEVIDRMRRVMEILEKEKEAGK